MYSNVTQEAASGAYRASGFVAELLAHGDDVSLIFDGDGGATLSAVLDPKHELHRAWTKAAPALRGVCGYCARAYGVADALKSKGITFLSEDHSHASLREMLAQGRQIVTF